MTWLTYHLGEVIENAQSGFACGDKTVADGFKHLRMNNIHSDGRLDLSLVRTVPRELATAKYRLHRGDVLVCTTNSAKLVGKSTVFDMTGDFAFSNHLTRLRMRKEVADPAFVQKQLWFKWLRGEIEPLCKHWVNQSTLPKAELLDLELLLPDFQQQRRIAKKLDHVAARLDDARARLDTIPTILKRFRMSVLAAACSGTLAAESRDASAGLSVLGQETTDLPACWDSKTIATVTESTFYGPRFAATDYSTHGTPTIRTSDIDFKGGITLDGTPRVRLSEREIQRYGLLDGDIVVTRTGATIGKCAAYSSKIGPAIPSAYLIRVRLNQLLVNPKFVLFNLLSPAGQRHLLEGTTAVAQPNINANAILSLPLGLPSLYEQEKIVACAEQLLAHADDIDARYRKARTFTDKLMPSVLAKALRGELI
jgi:type I restriction enzyme S subunit